MNQKKYVIVIGIGLMLFFAACNDNGMNNQNDTYDSTGYSTTPDQTMDNTTTVDTMGNMNDTMRNDTNPGTNR